jgi:hypothetical protein
MSFTASSTATRRPLGKCWPARILKQSRLGIEWELANAAWAGDTAA